MYVISFLSESFFVRTTLGCSSQSKRFESCIGVLIDLVRAAVVDYPLQHIQVTIAGCTRACRCIPRAALAPEPLHDLQIAAFADKDKEFPIQLEPLLGCQPLQGLQLASAHCEEEKERKRDVKSRNKEEEEETVEDLLLAALVISYL